jgi:hypothetical protein
MSYDTHKNFFYEHVGRKLRMWQLQSGGAVDTLGGYKIKLPSDTYGSQLVYPDEDITSGVRVEYTALNEPFIAEALETTTAIASGTGISFDPGPAATISDDDDGFSDFVQGDKIRVIGSASNDGDYTLTPSGTVDEDTLTITGTFTLEAVGESITVYQIPKEVTSPDETSHVNLNRMLSLAVVCYVMAQLATDPKEQGYYMNLFWRKVGDGESNKRQVSTIMTSAPYAIK